MTDLISRLPPVIGKIEPSVSLANHSWFGVGGMAEALFTPADRDDLAAFLRELPHDIGVFVLGAGSNLLIRDGGIRGVVINTANLKQSGRDDIGFKVGAGLHDAEVARLAAKMGLMGLEFLVGIPGTIGGGLRMNAGAYGSEMKDIVIKAEAIDREGRIHTATPAEMGMGYRHSDAPDDWIFTAAWLKAEKGTDGTSPRQKMKSIIAQRGEAQPTGARTGGSTFANPEKHLDGGHKAWQLIDQAGLRGAKYGRAMVSQKHCNFLINTGGASAFEIETLGEMVREKVLEKTGINLRWEIHRVGIAAKVTEAVND